MKRFSACTGTVTLGFVLDVSSFLENSMTQEPAKRKVIQAVSSNYDPLGFITLLIVRLKMLFQRLCEKRLASDEELDEQLKGE